MKVFLVLPLIIPLAAAAVLMLTRRLLAVQRCVGVLASAALFAAAIGLFVNVLYDGIQVMQIGNWPAPFGITLVADRLSAAMVLVTGFMGFGTSLYSIANIDIERQRFGYFPLLQILLMGVCGAFLTGDIFNLYVWFEVMLIASFVLLALGGKRAQLEGAVKYVTLNLLASAIFLAGVGILYGATGTLNMADLALKLTDFDERIESTLAILFLIAFGVKAAVFPLFFWLPASYHTPPVAVSAIFAGLLTKVGVYALVRVFTLLFVHDIGYTHLILLVVAGLTMVTGVLGAMAQNDMRRVLSFHIVSQIGYMVMGLALYTPLALAGTVFYIIHHIIVKTNLFLISGLVYRYRGTNLLARVGGMYRDHPMVGLLFLIPALSLAGLPPLSGFFAKLILIRAGLEAEQYGIVATALAVGLLTLFSMTKIWNEVFWKAQPESDTDADSSELPPQTSAIWLFVPIVLMAATTVAIGVAAGPLLDFSIKAAEQLLDPRDYITAVMGKSP